MSHIEALPPSPTESARAALAAGAENMAVSRMQREIQRRVPRVLQPLLPWVSGSVQEEAGKEAKRRVRRWISGLVATVIFFVVFGLLVVGTLLFAAACVAVALAGM